MFLWRLDQAWLCRQHCRLTNWKWTKSPKLFTCQRKAHKTFTCYQDRTKNLFFRFRFKWFAEKANSTFKWTLHNLQNLQNWSQNVKLSSHKDLFSRTTHKTNWWGWGYWMELHCPFFEHGPCYGIFCGSQLFLLTDIFFPEENSNIDKDREAKRPDG